MITTPINILEKEGRVRESERQVMERHVVATEIILEGNVEEEILQIAIRHHEKIDGTGYPYGISGECLSMSERIVAVADILSALSMKRSYKEAFDKESIVNILNEMKLGKKLCPEIVDVATQHYNQIMTQVYAECGQVLDQYARLKNKYYEMIG